MKCNKFLFLFTNKRCNWNYLIAVHCSRSIIFDKHYKWIIMIWFSILIVPNVVVTIIKNGFYSFFNKGCMKWNDPCTWRGQNLKKYQKKLKPQFRYWSTKCVYRFMHFCFYCVCVRKFMCVCLTDHDCRSSKNKGQVRRWVMWVP